MIKEDLEKIFKIARETGRDVCIELTVPTREASEFIVILNDNLDYKILTSDTNEIIKDDSVDACIKMVLKLRNNIIVQNGDGSEFNPYIINMQNY